MFDAPIEFWVLYAVTYFMAGGLLKHMYTNDGSPKGNKGWMIFFFWLPLMLWMILWLFITPYRVDDDDTSQGD